MELRCQNCHARLSVPSVGPLKEVQCPKCHVMMMLPRPELSLTPADDLAVERKHRDALRRVFEPIPRSVMYVAGILLGLAIFSPFWVYLITDRFVRKPVYLSDDAPLVPGATNAVAAPAPALLGTNRTGGADLTQYAGVRLEAHREELDHRFNLALQNTRGMQPEIYVARAVADIEQITALLYDGVLKEFTLIMCERVLPPAAVEQQLVEQFGEPIEQRDGGRADATAGLGSLGLGEDVLVKKLTTYSHRRTLVWADSVNRIDATIYYSNGDSPRPVTVLELRLTAAAWLKANRPMVGATAPVPVPAVAPDRLTIPIAPLDRKLAP